MSALQNKDYIDLPGDLRDEVERSKGKSLYGAISEEKTCDEHERALYRASNNYGYICEKCWEKIGDGWIPHADLTDQQKEQAYSREEVERWREEYENEIRARVEKQYLQRAEEILNEEVVTPPTDADAENWVECFSSVPEHDWWKVYAAYLDSDAWKERREACFEMKGRTCTAALKGCQESAAQAHHITYRHAGQEPVFELEPICESCHEKLHRYE